MNEFDAVLQNCLSERVRVESVRRENDIFVLRFHDDADVLQCVEFWDKSSDRKSFRIGRRLAFAYRPNLVSRAHEDVIPWVIGVLIQNEERLVAWMAAYVETPSIRPVSRPPLFLRETWLGLQILRVLPRSGSVARAAQFVLDEALEQAGQTDDVQIYFETRCAQACEFCEEPRIRDKLPGRAVTRLLTWQHELTLDLVSSGAFEALVAAIAARDLRLTVTGHDWTGHPHVEQLLRILERHPGVRLRLQGPSLALDSLEMARRVAALPALEAIVTTLQSSDPAEHDAMVGARGAHARLMRALENLELLKVRVQLSLVLTRRALRSLPATLRYLKERAWTIELSAFVPDQALGDVSDKLAPLDELRRAIEASIPEARDTIRSLVGVPVCGVPEIMRGKVALVLRTDKRAATQFGTECADCRVRLACSGVPAGYLRALGTRGMVALRVGGST